MDDTSHLPPRRARPVSLAPAARRPDPVDLHVGERLVSLRRARKLSQAELARRLALSFQQIQKYETGANRISASKLWAAGRALDVSIDDFFSGLETNEEAPSPRLNGLLEREAGRLSPAQQKALVAFLRSVGSDD